MRYDTACMMVASSPLMEEIRRIYGDSWENVSWIRVYLAGYVGALEGSRDPQKIFDEMEEMRMRVRGIAIAN